MSKNEGKTRSATAAAEAEEKAAIAAAAKSTGERVRRATKTALALPPYSLKKIKDGDFINIRVDSEISEKADVDHKTGKQKEDKNGKPAVLHLVKVTDLDTGEVGEMVLPFIVHKALAEIKPLTGQCFELVKVKSEANKATMWEVSSIEG